MNLFNKIDICFNSIIYDITDTDTPTVYVLYLINISDTTTIYIYHYNIKLQMTLVIMIIIIMYDYSIVVEGIYIYFPFYTEGKNRLFYPKLRCSICSNLNTGILGS